LSDTLLDLQSDPNRPDVLQLQQGLLSDQPSLIPRRSSCLPFRSCHLGLPLIFGTPNLLSLRASNLGAPGRGGRLAYDVGLYQEICTPRPKKKSKDTRNFINVAVSKETRAGLHLLKDAIGAAGQAEVIEKLVAIGMAIRLAAR